MTEKNINGITIRHYGDLNSTNKTAIAEDNAPHLLTVVADNQSGGRGRMGRSYFSYDGGLYMSVILDIDEIKIPLSLCTPAAAVAVFDALTSLGVQGHKIKWVNDIYKDGKKVCGILTEAASEGGKIKRVVVGIGINLTHPEGGFPEEISHKAGALGLLCNKLEVASAVTSRLGELIKAPTDSILEKYQGNMLFIGQKATVTDYADGNKKIDGKVLGVSQDGGLTFADADGNVRILTSGEII